MKVTTAIRLAAMLACISLMPALAHADRGWDEGVEFVQALGRIDWVAGKAVASGAGVPPPGVRLPAMRRTLARRAAVIDARRNLLEVIGAVRIDSTTKVKNYMVASDIIKASVRGMLTGSRIESESNLEDGSYLVEVSVPIRSALTPAALERAMPGSEPTAAVRGEASPPGPDEEKTGDGAATAGAPIEKNITEERPDGPTLANSGGQGYTGLVVDARGTGFTPSLVPKIIGPDRAIYPAPRTDNDAAADGGLVRYFTDMSMAQQSDRAGDKPLTIKASAAKNGSDILISPEDAATLSRMLRRPGNVLEKGRVVVVF
jgi:hypothetical protein